MGEPAHEEKLNEDGCLWKESVPLIHGNSSELRCRRQVRWFLPLHQSGRVLGKQISIVCREVVPELLCFPDHVATLITLLNFFLCC